MKMFLAGLLAGISSATLGVYAGSLQYKSDWRYVRQNNLQAERTIEKFIEGNEDEPVEPQDFVFQHHMRRDMMMDIWNETIESYVRKLQSFLSH